MRSTTRPPISAQARGQLRALWASAAADAAAIEAAAYQVPQQVLRDTRLGFGRRADTALATVIATIPITPMVRERRAAAWRYLRPAAGGLQVAILLLNLPGRPGLFAAPYGLTVSEHALGRLLDRSCFRADPVAATLEAHNAMFALEPAELSRLMALEVIELPGGPGCFLLTPDARSDRPAVIAKTWIGIDQQRSDQAQHAEAWARLLRPQTPTACSFQSAL